MQSVFWFSCLSSRVCFSYYLFSLALAAQRYSTVRPKDSAPPLQARDSTAASMEDFTYKDQTVCSYQQISCLDSVIRSGIDLVDEVICTVIPVQRLRDHALFAQYQSSLI